MNIISNGTIKEITVLKHFKIDTNEYIIYNDSNNIFLGQINENKITTPSSDNVVVLKNIIANFIGNNDKNINVQNNCIVLDNSFSNNLEGISAQNIKLTETQIANLKNEKTSFDFSNMPTNTSSTINSTTNVNNKKTNLRPILVVILLVLVAALLVFIFKGKGSNSSSSNGSDNGGSIQNLTPEKALEKAYAYTAKADYDGFMSITPSVMRDYYKKMLTRSMFEESMNSMYKEVGNNITAISNVTATKVDSSFLEDANKYFKQDISSNINITECYSYTGSVTIKGSKGEKIITGNDLSETWYCKVNGEWGFIFG